LVSYERYTPFQMLLAEMASGLFGAFQGRTSLLDKFKSQHQIKNFTRFTIYLIVSDLVRHSNLIVNLVDFRIM
jgi:hypothetical protein